MDRVSNTLESSYATAFEGIINFAADSAKNVYPVLLQMLDEATKIHPFISSMNFSH